MVKGMKKSKKFNIKNKGFFIVSLLFIKLFLIDIIISSRIKYIQYLELNPAFQYGGFLLILFINLVVWVSCIVFYTKSKNINLRFFIMFYFVVIILFRIFIIWNNIVVLNTPITYEEAVSIPQEVKNAQMAFIFLVNIFPILCGFVTWLFYSMDHNIKIKN